MKKNFFKKLSFVLALAMIVSVLAPAAGAFAAAKAPKLSASTKYLYLGVEDKNEYDFNIANKQTGWKYLWSSSNEKVADVNAKNGLTTAAAAGKSTISVVITDKDGEEIDELTATVYVRDNMKELTITNLPTDNKVAVGATWDFNRSYVTVAGKKTGSEAKVAWTVTKDGKATTDATIDGYGKFTAKAAGEYVVEVRAFQSSSKRTAWVSDPVKYASYVTNPVVPSVKVTVAASMTGVKQTTLSAANVTFDSAMTDVAKNISVYQVIGTTKVKQLVKEVKLDDAKKVATVTMYVPFTQEATYVVDYPNMKSVQFVAARAKAEDVKSMELATKTAVLNTAKTVEVKLFDANGVDITAATGLNDRVTMTSTGEAYTSFSGKTLYMYKKDVTTTIKAVYHTYNYSKTTGAEEGNLEVAGVITCVEADATNVSGVNAWTITAMDKAPDWNSLTKTIAAGDTRKLSVKLDTVKGDEKTTVNSYDNSTDFEFTSSDNNVMIVDNNGKLVANKEGVAVVVVKYGTGTATKVAVATIEITVAAKRAATQFSLDSYEFTLSNASSFADTKVVAITLKDQLGDDFAYDNYKVELISKPDNATAVTPVGSSILKGDGKITFVGQNMTKGTYVYRVTVKDLSRVVTVTVDAPTAGETAKYWRLDFNTRDIDMVSASEKVAKSVTMDLYGYTSNGVKVSKETLNTTTGSSLGYRIDIDVPSAAANDSDVTYSGNTFALVTATSGQAIVKRPVGTYRVSAYRWDTTVTATDKWVPVDTQYFATTDTQVAPVVAEVKSKLFTSNITSYAAVTSNTSLINAVDECYKITVNGVTITKDNIVKVEANGSETAAYITSITVRTAVKIDKDHTDVAYLEQKVAINEYITKK